MLMALHQRQVRVREAGLTPLPWLLTAGGAAVNVAAVVALLWWVWAQTAGIDAQRLGTYLDAQLAIGLLDAGLYGLVHRSWKTGLTSEQWTVEKEIVREQRQKAGAAFVLGAAGGWMIWAALAVVGR
jgi:hypothetical protein